MQGVPRGEEGDDDDDDDEEEEAEDASFLLPAEGSTVVDSNQRRDRLDNRDVGPPPPNNERPFVDLAIAEPVDELRERLESDQAVQEFLRQQQIVDAEALTISEGSGLSRQKAVYIAVASGILLLCAVVLVLTLILVPSGDDGKGTEPLEASTVSPSYSPLPSSIRTILPSLIPSLLFSQQPSLNPSTVSSPKPSQEPSLGRITFQTRQELLDAVDAYEAFPVGSPGRADFPHYSFWDVSMIDDFSSLFSENRNDRNVLFNDPGISEWNVSQGRSFSSMFRNARSFNQDLVGWDVSRATDLSSMFHDAILFDGDICNFQTSRVVNMASFLQGAARFNGDVSNLDVSDVVIMDSLFAGARSFNRSLSSWNTSSCESMSFTFEQAFDFDQELPFDTSRVESMAGTFRAWNTSRVRNMANCFQQAFSFNQDLGSWDVSNVQIMGSMFYETPSFDATSLSAWDTSSCLTMRLMFASGPGPVSSGLVGDLSGWQLSNVERTDFMFNGNERFNHSLCSWSETLGKETIVDGMFAGASSCLSQATPNLTSAPPGPFCHPCS